MRTIARKILVLTTALALSACSNSTLLSGGKGNSKDKKDEEDEGADEPVPISGSYLTCDWTEQQKTEPGQTTTIGCTVNDEDGKAFPRKGYDYQLALFNNKEQVEMVTADPSSDSQFHKTALLPSEYNTKGYLLMTMRHGGEDIGTWTIDTTVIGANVGLGKEVEGTAADVTAGSVPLKSVTRHGLWDGRNGGFGLGRMVFSAAFCDAGGIVRKTLSDTAKSFMNDSYEISTTIETSEHTTNLVTGPGEPNTCFSEFKLDWSQSDWAHASDDEQCLFLSSGHYLYIFSKPKIDDPNFTLENLRKFAEARRCR